MMRSTDIVLPAGKKICLQNHLFLSLHGNNAYSACSRLFFFQPSYVGWESGNEH